MNAVNKLILEIETFFNLLKNNSTHFQLGESIFQWLLLAYWKSNGKLENVIEEFKLDKSDFLSYLYNIEIRARALRDILNPFNMRVDTIKKELNNREIIPYRISEIEDEDGLCFYFKKENYNVYLEIYRDLEMRYIVEDRVNKKTIANVDIGNINEFVDYMRSNT